MFPLGHAMLPAGLALLLQRRGLAPAMDLRLVMLGGLLPDLVDKPLTLLLLPDVRHGHWLGHTLLAAALLGLLALRARPLAPLALGVGSHALLDRLPVTEPAAWLWPALGPFPAGGFGDPLAALAGPWTLAGELAGLAVLAALALRGRLHEPARLRAFVARGIVLPAMENPRFMAERRAARSARQHEPVSIAARKTGSRR